MKIKKKSKRGRKRMDPKDKRQRIYGGYKDPQDITRLGGPERVTELLSQAFDQLIAERIP